MPESAAEQQDDLADQVRLALGDKLTKYREDLETLRDVLDGKVDVTELTDAQLADAVAAAGRPPISADEQEKRIREWDPVDLLVPEWEYLQKDPIGPHQEDPASGLTLSKQERGPDLPHAITRVLAVERLRKVTRWSDSPASTTWTGSATCPAASPR